VDGGQSPIADIVRLKGQRKQQLPIGFLGERYAHKLGIGNEFHNFGVIFLAT
jgi:hypothetical protein